MERNRQNEKLQDGNTILPGYEDYQQFDKTSSKRSIDYRDSGIVLDDEIFEFEHQQKQHSSEVIINDTNTCNNTKIPIYEPDEDGDTILHLAVVGCSIGNIEDLMKICAKDLDAINNMMQTPMHVATMANRPEMVNLLIEKGAKIDVHDRRGNTPLHIACQKGLLEVVQIILDKSLEEGLGCKLEKLANFDGQTCLHLAALNRQEEVTKLLVLKYNFNINCRESRSGSTPLHDAIQRLDLNLVSFILGFDKHCNEMDYYGRRPLDTCRVLKNSLYDRERIDKLMAIEEIIRDRIKLCLEQDGCCGQLNDPLNEQMSDSDSTSSSDYSDSDSNVS